MPTNRPGKKTKTEKVQPWPDSTFAIETRWDKWGPDKHFWVHLQRRAPGKFGRLQAMHAIVPGKRKGAKDSLFGSAKYRENTLDSALKLFRQAGVPEDQAAQFMDAISSEFPYPTTEELFLEQIHSPIMAIALGEARQYLSYYRTGTPQFTGADAQLVQTCFRQLSIGASSPEERTKLLDLLFRGGLV